MEKCLGEVFSIKEISACVKIPSSTLSRLAKEKNIPTNKIGRHWRFHKRAIDRWRGGIKEPPRAKRSEKENRDPAGKERTG
jgi:excisionase family DNA binding protein